MKCRHCAEPLEGLPHVLCHCHNNLPKILQRHNLIVDWLSKASSNNWSLYKQNQTVAGSKLKPDLVLTRGDAAMILDVAVTFENGPQPFDKIRQIKINKYQSIAKSLKLKYKEVSVEAIVLDALVSLDPKNDGVCHRLCSKKYTKLMRKLMVSDTLRSSRDIYIEHVSNKPQSQPPRYREFFNPIADPSASSSHHRPPIPPFPHAVHLSASQSCPSPPSGIPEMITHSNQPNYVSSSVVSLNTRSISPPYLTSHEWTSPLNFDINLEFSSPVLVERMLAIDSDPGTNSLYIQSAECISFPNTGLSSFIAGAVITEVDSD